MPESLPENVARRLRQRWRRASPGRLESVQEAAWALGVSKATVQKALGLLKEKGWLQTFRGKGTFRVGSGGADFAGGPGGSTSSLTRIIKSRILDGTYRVGEVLPKVSYFTGQENVSPDTVCAALKILAAERLIWKRGRSWVAGKPQAAPRMAARQAQEAPALLVLVPDFPSWDRTYHDFHAGKFVQSFYLEIERMGIETRLATWQPAPEGQFPSGPQAIRSLIQGLGRRYRGTLFISGRAQPDLLAWLGRFRQPVVWMDLECLVEEMDMRLIPGEGRIYRCLKDEGAAVGLALRSLADLGHRRIGFPVFPSPDFPWISHRLGLLREQCRTYDPPLELFSLEHWESFWHPKPWAGPEEFPAWMRSLTGSAPAGSRPAGPSAVRKCVPSLVELVEKRKVTALLAPNDFFAHQYLLWLRELGISVPGRLSLLSFDNNHFSRPFSLSTIDFGFADLGYRMAHIFIGDVPVQSDRGRNVHGQPSLLLRGTLGPPPGKWGRRGFWESQFATGKATDLS